MSDKISDVFSVSDLVNGTSENVHRDNNKLANAIYLTKQNPIYLSFNPKEDITTYELALCIMPFVKNIVKYS
jgi:hypothetical protein